MNGVEEEKRRVGIKKKVELGRVGRKCIGHWVNGVGEEKNGEEPE